MVVLTTEVPRALLHAQDKIKELKDHGDDTVHRYQVLYALLRELRGLAT